MAMSNEFVPTITDLPYKIPADINKQIAKLSKVIGIPGYLMWGKRSLDFMRRHYIQTP